MNIKVGKKIDPTTLGARIEGNSVWPCAEHLAYLVRLGKRRHGSKEHYKSSRPLSKDYELVGLLGEYAFMALTGYKMDTSVTPVGDGGVDFYTPLGAVDIKTHRLGVGLLIEKKELKAAYYIEAMTLDCDAGAELHCAAHANDSCNWEVADFGGHGIISYRVPRITCDTFNMFLWNLQEEEK